MTSAEAFLKDIERFLKRTGMKPTAFGKEAVGDGNFVTDLREGRAPSLRLVERVNSYIRSHQEPAQ
jgi:hypothetical protein